MQNNKYLILISVILLQSCLGGTYAWSIFDRAFTSELSLSATLASLPFNIFYVVFPLTLLVARGIIEKLGTQISAVAGIVFFALGWMVASLGELHFGFTLFGVGVLGGVGVGITYLIPILVGVSWFPARAGLVTGLAVGGFAAGAMLVGRLASTALTIWQVGPFEALSYVSVAYLVLGLFPAVMMKPAEQSQQASCAGLRLSELVRSFTFWQLFIAMTAGLAAGFFVNSKLVTIGVQAPQWLLSLVTLFALSNALGRVCWGALSDRYSINSCLMLNLAGQGITLLLLLAWQPFDFAANLLAILAGFHYGGVLVLYANKARLHWGSSGFSQVYSFLFLSNILAALVNTLLSSVFAAWGTYPVAALLILLLTCGTIAIQFNSKPAFRRQPARSL